MKDNPKQNQTEQDDFLYDDETDHFIPCERCDCHPACEDFGCAFELGVGKMVKKDNPRILGDWG